ncbi:hypothetical protein IQ247_23230 [Plectonema cf. radiosum LEGE 06105]|uniref:Uncharacterized protein n=1 Tax=Plectonema cf. radiosum LEGE 06105 TaxID=945769 RepID=A0A8J7K3T1_9CYAN|nr:hypothetical protein [Plectonema radiosum]MBE9215542.1 hypothetical protein [Plectonema cf. radiosum LEGE 06105]
MHISKKDRERAPKKEITQNVSLIDYESDFLHPLEDRIPQIDNIPQKYPIISKNPSVKIGEWQPLYLDKWENLVPLEPVMGRINGN